jgi:hypothetical protein
MSSIARSHSEDKWLCPALDAGFFILQQWLVAGDEQQEVPQGISEANRRATKTRSKISAES